VTFYLNTIEATRAGVCLLLGCVVGILSVSRAVAQDTKRGVGGSEIAQANALNGRWYYNWGNNPPADVLNGSLNGEYVPMIWSANAGTIQARVDNILGYASSLGVDYVLGFNEPDRAEQANMSVATAISLWDVMDDQFANAGIKLVSPALGDDTGGRAWLDDFMNQANALNLQVDAVAMHWYGNVNISNPTATANGFLSRVDSWHNTYGKPIWITEFAGMDWGVDDITSEDLIAFNEAFLAVVIPGLESRSYVERYAWWQYGRRDVPGEENDTQLIEQVGGLWTPTGIGDQYVPSYREGEQFNLSGSSPGDANFYLRGGSLVNATGPTSVTVASVDAIDGNSDLGGAVDWRIENGVLRVRNNAILRKIGSNKITVSGSTFSNSGEIQLVSGTLALEKGAELAGPGSVDLETGATLVLGAAIDRSGAVVSQPIDLNGGVIQVNQIIDGVHSISGALMVLSTSTFTGDGTVIVSGPLQSPASGVAGGIVKAGVGTVVVTGNNNFRGNVEINAGKLEMTAGATMSAASGFAVASGARFDVSGLPAGLTLASGQTLANQPGGRVEGNVVVGDGAVVSAAGVFDGNVVAQSGGMISIGGDGALMGESQTVFFTPPLGTLGSNSDVRVRSGSGANANQNDTAALGLGSISATDSFRSLLTFDLSSTGITDPNYVNSVALTMTLLAPNGAQVNADPTLELLTIGAFNSDTATFNNTPFNAANVISTTTGPNFGSGYAAGATLGWSQATSGAFVDAVKNALGGSLHLGARAATNPGTRSFYFIDQAETTNAGAAPSLAITYSIPTNNPIGSATVEADFTLASGSTLEVDLLSATLYDQLDVNGAASLSGVLSVDALDLDQLAINDTFTILTADSIVNNLTLGGPDGNLFNLSASTPTSLVLTYAGAVVANADFDNDGDVDGRDFLRWQRGFGLTGQTNNSNGDANGDSFVNSLDLAVWQTKYGLAPPLTATSTAVPEPTAAALVVLALLAASRLRHGSNTSFSIFPS